jgi:quinol monooxygenase YgiN
VGELLGIARFKFKQGKLEEYKRLNERAMEIVKAKDTGTLQYEIFFNDGQSEAIVLERYESSAALMEQRRARCRGPGRNLGDSYGERRSAR